MLASMHLSSVIDIIVQTNQNLSNLQYNPIIIDYMGLSSLCLIFVSMFMLSKLMLLYFVVANSLQSYTTTCHDDEISAMLQFKQSFVVNITASLYKGAYPKMATWKSTRNQTINCCSWDGVECDEKTGHVVGLHLNSSCLYGSINSDSSLFRLVHLHSLNLADNDFNFSQVSISIRNFQRLRYLNLSDSNFYGQVPSEVSQLSKLSSLDISNNYGMFSKKGFLRSIAQNLTSLEKLDLSYINISSAIPDTLANLSLLTSLHLEGCDLLGQFPVRIFSIQNLEVLSVSDNLDLVGYVPEVIGNICPLRSLKLSMTKFFINMPSLIETFDKLEELGVSTCNISEGVVPSSLGNLRHLIHLDLSYNKFKGQIPAWLGNFTQLTYLSLSGNKFHGSIPRSLFNLMNLRSLYLDHNNLSGTVEFHMFHKLQKLTFLSLSRNNLEVLTESRFMNNATPIPKFEYLRLAMCNIREFPNFLKSQETLKFLDLSGNKLQGQVPKWMLNTSTKTLQNLDISYNFLSGFEQSPVVLPWVKLEVLQLQFNMLRELSPLPSTFIIYYKISDNKLTGEVPPLICNLTSLYYLDLSNNKLSGILPQCLGNFSDNMQYLSLGNNSFHGILPQTYTSKLVMIDVSHNNFHGKLPRSLVNCAELESLFLSHNEFSDGFPIWLGTLPNLKILKLDHNEFYGVIRKAKKLLHFPVLYILDLSYNNFSSEFPFEYIFSGNGTTSITLDHLEYISVRNWYYSITITSKGVERYYPRILKDFVVIDISSNKFEGNVPEFIGKLKGLRSLNISNNILTGSIPSSLGNLTLLESLDLSQNKLSGGIPQQLTQLTFLAKLNVSHNYLTGRIPSGTQLITFDITSYEGNPGLCGDPLPKKCGNPEVTQPPPSTAEENDSGSKIEWDWKFVLAGLGSGLVVGMVLADFAITKWNEWFMEIVAVLIRLSKRMRRAGN